MQQPVVRAAQHDEVARRVRAAFRALLQMVDVDVDVVPATRQAAVMMIARKHLRPDPRRDVGDDPLRRVGVDPSELLGIASRALPQRAPHLDRPPGGIHRGPLASLAHGQRDPVRRAAAHDDGSRNAPRYAAAFAAHVTTA